MKYLTKAIFSILIIFVNCKLQSVSEKDFYQHNRAFTQYNLNILNTLSNRQNPKTSFDWNGKLFLDFSNVEVPSELTEYYSITALRNFFYSDHINIEKMDAQLDKLIHPNNWSWTVEPTNPYLLYYSEYQIILYIHNNTNFPHKLSDINISITDIGDYNLKYQGKYEGPRTTFGLSQKQDGKFITEINYETYQKIRNANKVTAKITHLFWQKFYLY